MRAKFSHELFGFSSGFKNNKRSDVKVFIKEISENSVKCYVITKFPFSFCIIFFYRCYASKYDPDCFKNKHFQKSNLPKKQTNKQTKKQERKSKNRECQ